MTEIQGPGLGDDDPAVLVLADGTSFSGSAPVGAVTNGLGKPEAVVGEVVFNTALSGYQEVISDPSYAGQIVAMTYPHIGNYGANAADDEAKRPVACGLAVRSLTRAPSGSRHDESFPDYLDRSGVGVIEGIDTRRLTRHIRDEGAMPGAIFFGDDAESDTAALTDRVREAPGMQGRDLASEVTTRDRYASSFRPGEARFRVGLVDFGVKRTILRRLADNGCDVTVFPAATEPDEILSEEFDGIMLSNGPGDPAAVSGAPGRVSGLLGEVPVFGICLGHQILGLALGAETEKLPFGHHGGNHPVLDISTGRVEITAQNHGFAVRLDDERESAYGTVAVTHRNLNDGTLEGLRCTDIPAFSVQHHPEAGPGPHDATYLFDRFCELMKKGI